MRIRQTLAVGVILTLPLLSIHTGLRADGPFKRHHHGDCPTDQSSTVRLPAQTIRIETTKPRVVVSEGPASSRVRGFLPASQTYQGPFIATILSPGAFNSNASTSGGSSSLDLTHALERHAMEIAKARAMRAAEMNAENEAMERIQRNVASFTKGAAENRTSESAQVRKAIEELSQRITAIEKLLIIHDDRLKQIPINPMPPAQPQLPEKKDDKKPQG